MLPAIATAPIVFTADDGTVHQFQKGDYVHAEIHAKAKDSHHHSLVPVAHSEYVCPDSCTDDSHKPAPPQRSAPPALPVVTPSFEVKS